jgi:hypothetical protein
MTLDGAELLPYQMKLSMIDAMRIQFMILGTDGKFLDSEGGIPEGQAILIGLLENCYDDMRVLQMADD